MDIEKQRKIQNIIFFGILGLLILYYVAFKLDPVVTSVSPAPGKEVMEFYTPISFTFNKPIITERVDILISPPAQGRLSWNPLHTQVRFIPIKPWRVSTTYTVSVTALVDNKTQILAQTVFTEKDTGTDSKVTEARNEYATQNYPLFDSTPWKTDLFEVDYAGPNSLQIKVASFSKKKEIEQKIKQWMLSKKINPSTHVFVWKLE